MIDEAAIRRSEDMTLYLAAAVAAFVHAAAIGVAVAVSLAALSDPRDSLIQLAVMDFSDYDPLGGQGGVEELTLSEPEAPAEPVLEPPAEPEPPEPVEEVNLVESAAEAAVPAPPPPPPEKQPKKEAKPKPKPAPKAVAPGPGTGEPAQAPGIGGSGPGGAPGGTGKGNADAVGAYMATVRKRLERHKKYPPSAKSGRLEGVATVRFIVLRNGVLSSPNLVKSSGHRILDEEVMALLSRASPFPATPEDFPNEGLTLTVPLRFSLR
jgi:protein TonB